MADSPAWKIDVTAVLVHPHVASIWLHQGVTPTLHFRHDGDAWFADIAPVIAAFREQWNIDPIVLRCADMAVDRPARHLWLTFLAQPNTLQVPLTGHWIPIATLEPDSLPDDPSRAPLLSALRAIDAPPPVTRRPWATRGWFEQAVDWSTAALHAAALELLSPPVQIRTWGLSTIIRFDTSDGACFFKAALFSPESDDSSAPRSPLFANEAALLQTLAARIPAHMPVPLAVDTERVWMLLSDAGLPLFERPSLDLWEHALRLHARHQRSWLGQQDALFQAGCLDRRLSRLSQHLDDILNDDTVLQHLESHEQDRLRTIAPLLDDQIAELSALPIPVTLTHGDLHTANIAVRDDRPIFFDWTNAAVAHPFLDLATFLDDADTILSDPAARPRLTAAYIAEWRDVAPASALQRAAELAAPLGILHQSISYQRVSPNVEEPNRTPMARGAASWLRALFDHLPPAEHP